MGETIYYGFVNGTWHAHGWSGEYQTLDELEADFEQYFEDRDMYVEFREASWNEFVD